MINEMKSLLEQNIEFCHKNRRYYLYKIVDKQYLILKFKEDGELCKVPEEKFDNAEEAIKRWLELVNLSPSIPDKKKKK